MLAPGAARPAELQEILNDIVEDVNEAIQNALKLVHSDLGNQNVALYTEFAPHLPTVNGDGVRLQQVLLNVVVNGCDAMADVEAVGRRLLVRTELADGKEVRVSVVDWGRGIPSERIERIFEPFFTTKRNGMGLGLEVYRSFISAHGGRLWLTDNAERGATFQFTLPID